MDWSSTATLASWWGYAQADPTLVGVVVAVIGVFSVVHVARRALAERRRGPGRRGLDERGIGLGADLDIGRRRAGRPGDASPASRVRSR